MMIATDYSWPVPGTVLLDDRSAIWELVAIFWVRYPALAHG